MELHTVTITPHGGTITAPGSNRAVDWFDSFQLPGNKFDIAELNRMLWARGWSIAAPWRVTIRDSRTMELESRVLRRG